MTPLNDEARALAAEHYDWAMGAVRPFVASTSSLYRDDILSAAMMGLCLAAMKYDPIKTPDFKKYASTIIRQYIIDGLRLVQGRSYQSNNRRYRMAMTTYSLDKPDNPAFLLPRYHKGFDDVDIAEFWETVCSRCTRYQARALRAFLLTGTCKEAGRLIGRVESSVFLHLKAIRERIIPTIQEF